MIRLTSGETNALRTFVFMGLISYPPRDLVYH